MTGTIDAARVWGLAALSQILNLDSFKKFFLFIVCG
jgi:hypothetical protein